MSLIQNNINALLLKCVEFYSDEKNYEKKLANKQSQIDLDQGFVGRETMKTVAHLLDEEAKLDELAKQLEAEESPESVLEQIKEITKHLK